MSHSPLPKQSDLSPVHKLNTSYNRFNMMMEKEACVRIQGKRIYHQADHAIPHFQPEKRIHEDFENINGRRLKGTCPYSINYNFEFRVARAQEDLHRH